MPGKAWVMELSRIARREHTARNADADFGSLVLLLCFCLLGPARVPKIMAQDPRIESMGSIGSIILAILEVPVCLWVSLVRLLFPILKSVL